MTYLELAHRARRGTSPTRAPAPAMTNPSQPPGWNEAALAQTVTNLKQLSVAELAAYRAELAAAAPVDSWLAFDREALRRAEAAMNGEETTP